jgi:hypothetical protein
MKYNRRDNVSPVRLSSVYLKCKLIVVGLLCVCGSGCGFVDSSFDSRIDTINESFGSARDKEILTNIIRASRFEPLHFYLHSRLVPSQTSDVQVGLPTMTFGPPGQHQFAFTTAVDNSASLSLEIDPIETKDFHNNLLTPIPIGIISLLLQTFPRELVFLTLFDSVKFQESGDTEIEYKNDPDADGEGCHEYHYDGSDGDSNYDPNYDVSFEAPGFVGVPHHLSDVNPYRPPGTGEYADLRRCRYQRFRYWIANAIAYGLWFESETTPHPKSPPNDPKGASPPTIGSKVCFDPALAQRSLKSIVAKFDALCGSVKPPPSPGKGRATIGRPDAFPFHYTGMNGQQIKADIRLRPRSLYGVYTYLGRLLLDTQKDEFVPVYTMEARSNGDTVLFNARGGLARDCFAATSFGQGKYCIPASGADNTHRVFSLLTELTSLLQTASDIPNGVAVRLTP